jgi:S-DNA-T family DNA segregation ATPase FtsK/SpoIIIE
MAERKKKPGRPSGTKNKSNKMKEKEIMEKEVKNRLKDEIWAIIIIAIGAFLVVSLQTEAAGQFGRFISDLLKGFFSIVAYILPYYLIIYGVLLFVKKATHICKRSVILIILIFLTFSIINSARYIDSKTMTLSIIYIKEAFKTGVVLKSGGAFGMAFGLLLQKAIGKPGLYMLCSVVIIVCLLLVINTPVSQFTSKWKIKRNVEEQREKLEDAIDEMEPLVDEALSQKHFDKKPVQEGNTISKADTSKPIITRNYQEVTSLGTGITPGQMKIIDYMKDDRLFEGDKHETVGYGLDESNISREEKGSKGEISKDEKQRKEKLSETENKPEDLKINTGTPMTEYKLPPIELLSKAPTNNQVGDSINLKAKAIKLEQTLNSFGVNAKVLQVTKGPAVTRYEIQPDVGVKVSSIVRLADDIALNLEAKSIRIEAPIPGKAAIGIEVENDRINLVAVREIIESREFHQAKSMISFAVGKDISGKSIVANLKEMPHLLIAGSTGSGKSVCINALIISILYRAKPDEVKFVLIDPKVVELGNYNGIPHLLIPVVTEPSKAAAALNWAVSEMTDRYKKFADEGVRDLESYNTSIKNKNEPERLLPQIVIIIDELADLMMAAPSQVEESICRLAQMARAAGMHLIVATQRPSVDIITGVIKANIPSRISFAVSSQFDSRTILDMSGAEKLVGKGDMLFNPLGISKPLRVQGAFISDSEVHKVIDFLKGQVPENEYASDVINSIEKTFKNEDEDETDELLQEAIEMVVKAEQASVSMLQRRFRIGYNRAARLIDMMEARRIVGPSEGSRPRKVYMTEEEFLNLGKEPEAEES